MQVEKVKLGLEERPLYFGFNALARLGQLTNKEYSQLLQQDFLQTLSNQMLIAKVGLEDGARKSGSRETYNVEDIADWLDETPNALDEIFTVFMEHVLSITAKKAGLDEKKLIAETKAATEKAMKKAKT